MYHKHHTIALAIALAYSTHAYAQSAETPASEKTLSTVIVTGNPLGSDLFDLATPATALDGHALMFHRAGTLGETVDGLPGVSNTNYGPNVGRPVIRGLDGDRIRILQNGNGTLDASSLSFDHAVAIDPLITERIEVVRGPAALLYGGSAVGGVVNTIDDRIPQSAIEGFNGRVEGRIGGAADEKSGAAVLEAGNGTFALHADVYGRNTDDLKISGANISKRLQAQDPSLQVTRGTLPNSASHSDGGALGASLTSDRGYLGVSYSAFNANYGTVAEPDVKIDMQSKRWELAGEARDLGRAIESVKLNVQHTDYEHQELDLGVPATTFKNNGYEARLEARHGNLGPVQGALGVQIAEYDFSALGDEAFVPSTNTDSKALFVYEELPIDRLKLTAGGRYERSEIASDGGGRFGAAQSSVFNAGSGALGAVYTLTSVWSLAANGTYTQRAPTFYELYANGPHAATGVYEVGDRTLDVEKSHGLDLALRFKSDAHTGSIGVYRTHFNNYVTQFATGNTRGADGELNPVDVDEDGEADGSGEEILPEYAYRAVPANFYGFEMSAHLRVMHNAGSLYVLPHADYVHAENADTGEPLPRIAPLRIGLGLEYERGAWSAQTDLTRVWAQNRVAVGELPTDGYTMLNAGIAYHVVWTAQQAAFDVYLKGNNLLNEDARNHVSFLKDIAPLGGRSVMLGLRGSF